MNDDNQIEGSGPESVCRWMVQSKGWDECGAPATSISSAGLAFCDRHAAELKGCVELLPIPVTKRRHHGIVKGESNISAGTSAGKQQQSKQMKGPK